MNNLYILDDEGVEKLWDPPRILFKNKSAVWSFRFLEMSQAKNFLVPRYKYVFHFVIISCFVEYITFFSLQEVVFYPGFNNESHAEVTIFFFLSEYSIL